jgi:serine/threonine protein kinase
MPSPLRIPDHELLRRIGGGSYGEAWLARNVMGTLRALKVVYRRTLDHERPCEREYAGIQKFEPVSRSHEGFVDILQIGRNDEAGCFYYVMELADDAEVQNEKCKIQIETPASPGATDSQLPILSFEFSILNYYPKTLRSEIQRRIRLPFNDCITLGLSLARALAHLRAAGLVHRDIKVRGQKGPAGHRQADAGLRRRPGRGRGLQIAELGLAVAHDRDEYRRRLAQDALHPV